ncbi:MAG: UvrD-helicase domain-containing protein [Planctomycetota bacterium]|nr:UvrD-helicase domain-containing protein [Planctomycetota bacterium]
MQSDPHAELTPAQRLAVEHIDGPLLILAGPGSGKTRVVTHRIAHLIHQGVAPQQIVALTFTNKAADEMRERATALLGPVDGLHLSTFHRFCARMLRRHAALLGLTENFTIYDSDDSLRMLRHVLEKQGISSNTFSPRQIAAEISRAKNDLISASRYASPHGMPLATAVAEVYPLYQQQLLSASAVDFDDLLLHVATLLSEHPEVRTELDARYRYVLVDEYQDTNMAQYAILRALSHDHPNLAATGDPDQSIFGWRGANVGNILRFEEDFPEVQVVRLEQNYRSTKAILRAADHLIQHNQLRKHKQLFTHNAEGNPVELTHYADGRDEADSIALSILEETRTGQRKASDYAIFYRVNALSRSIEFALREHGIPYQLIKGLEFFQRKEVKDVIAYLQLISNPRDDVALLRVINTPRRGIGKKTLTTLTNHARSQGLPLLESARQAGLIEAIAKATATRVARFVAMYDRFVQEATGSLEELMGLVMSLSGYRDNLADSDLEEDQQRLANIEELLTLARQFDQQHPEGGALDQFLEEIALVGDTDDWEEDTDRVTLMTLHAAKGLEFPVVFLVACEEGLLPHERTRTDADALEEERRLLFVGITRAEQELRLSLARRRDFRGQRMLTIPSQFLLQLPGDELVQRESIALGGATFGIDDSEDHWEEDVEPMEQTSDSSTLAPTPFQATAKPETPAPPAAIQPATEMIGSEDDSARKTTPPCDVYQFRVGMRVTHPKYGLGKVAALGGSESARTATIHFATAGVRKFRLKESPLRPVGAKP